MSNFRKTSLLLLLLSFACEEKRVPLTECNSSVAAAPQERKAIGTVKPESPKPESTKVGEKDKPDAGTGLKSADANPEPKAAEAAPKMVLSAKVIPEPVKYDTDEMVKEIFDNKASQEEAKEDDLKKIRKDALRRLRGETASLPMEDEASAEAGASAETQAAPKPQGRELNKGETLYVKARIQGNKSRFQAARDLYLASCQAGFAEGCHKFAWHEEQAGNRKNANQFYRMACDSGLGKSCNNLAFQFEQEKNWDKALDFYANACMKKHEPSCMNLKRLREEMKAQ